MRDSLVADTQECLKICSDLLRKKHPQLKKINHQNCVDVCCDNEGIRNILVLYLQSCENYRTHVRKNEVYANDSKIKGNEHFKKGDYDEAIKAYTTSIFYAQPGKECLPLAYANRSLTFMKINEFANSLKDIDMALGTGYTKSKIPSLKLRKAKLLFSLGHNKEGEKILQDLLNDSQAKALKPIICKELTQQKCGLRQEKVELNKSIENTLPLLKGGENDSFKSASACLGLFYDVKKGRHVRACKDLDIGDVLFVEKPFAQLYFKGKICHNCGLPTLCIYPCDYCTAIGYCGMECKEKFWKSTHSFECSFSEFFKSIGIAHLSLRLVLAASSSFNELKTKLDSLDKYKPKEGPIKMGTIDYNDVYNLEANIEKFPVEDLVNYALTAFIMALYMKNYTSYFSKNNFPLNSDIKLLTSVFLRHIAQLICNGNAICLRGINVDRVVMSDYLSSKVGTAIYPSISMMNHSCDPSVITCFERNYVIVRASRAIKEGEEVFNCYGPHARRMPRNKRQVALSSQYFFDCDCPACIQEIDIMDVFEAWKCPACLGPCVTNSVNKSTPQRRNCLNCGKTLIPTKEQQATNSFIENVLIKTEGNIKTYLKAWTLGRKMYYKYNINLNRVANEISGLLYDARELDKCIKFMRCCLSVVEKQYGSNSIELAGEHEKFAMVLVEHGVALTAAGRKEEGSFFQLESLKYFGKSNEIMSLLQNNTKDRNVIRNLLSLKPSSLQ